MRFRSSSLSHLIIACVLAAGLLPSVGVGQEVEELRELIEMQREQLREMELRLQELEQERLREQVREGFEAAAPRVVAEESRVRSGDTGIDLLISGQINRMATVADDGDSTKLYNVDNANSSSRVRFVGRGETDAGFTVGTLLEAELTSNSSSDVNQRNQDTGSVTFDDRHIDLFFKHEDYGKVSIGQGDTSANSTAEVDLSGTTVIGYSSVSDTAGGLRFYDDDADELTDTTIGDVFSNFDGLSRRDRIRYDTPEFAGFQFAADAISSARYSTAVRWSGKSTNWRMAAAAGYSYPGGDSDYIIDGSASVRHQPTGLSGTFAAGTQENDGRDDATNVYVKLGWQQDFFTFGTTAMSLDLGRTEDLDVEGDEADTFGFQLVQDITDFGVEFYAGYRFHTLDRDDADFDDIHAVSAGSRVKF